MKISKKQLRKLIKEAFIVGPEGPESTRHLSGKLTSELGTDTHHDVADDFMTRCLNQINDPEMKNMLINFYEGEDADLASKSQAVDLAAGLVGASDKETEAALFDLDTALNPSFDDIKNDAFRVRVDEGLLKTFLNYLYKKGELYTESMSIYDIMDSFEKMYPGFEGPSQIDLIRAGIDFYVDGFIEKINPEKFKL